MLNHVPSVDVSVGVRTDEHTRLVPGGIELPCGYKRAQRKDMRINRFTGYF